MSYDNTNRGQIWKNDDKEKDTQPDYKGSVNVDGVEYWVSAWRRKEGANPKAPALSFTVKLKEQKQDVKPSEPSSGTANDDPFSDKIPF